MRTLISKYLYPVNYSLVRLYIMTSSLILFALYATFKQMDIWYILLFLGNLTLLNGMYKEVLVEYVFKKFWNNGSKNK
ncbi:hypothetical protein ACT7CR_03325 [Bacillus paranthracis]